MKTTRRDFLKTAGVGAAAAAGLKIPAQSPIDRDFDSGIPPHRPIDLEGLHAYADQISAALLETERPLPPPPEDPMSADRVRWEHIQRVFEQCNRNVSETARRLKMHRRTLQRILNKHAPRS